MHFDCKLQPRLNLVSDYDGEDATFHQKLATTGFEMGLTCDLSSHT